MEFLKSVFGLQIDSETVVIAAKWVAFWPLFAVQMWVNYIAFNSLFSRKDGRK